MSFIDYLCVHKSPCNPQSDVVHSCPIESEVPRRGPGDNLVSREEPGLSALHRGLRTLQGPRAPCAWPSLLHFHGRDKALTFPWGRPGQFRADRTIFGHRLGFLCHSGYMVGAGVCPSACHLLSTFSVPGSRHSALPPDETFSYVTFAHFTHKNPETQQFPPPLSSPLLVMLGCCALERLSLALGSWCQLHSTKQNMVPKLPERYLPHEMWLPHDRANEGESELQSHVSPGSEFQNANNKSRITPSLRVFF